ncbi:MAG TPA: HupE/UreJ family protein [Steroidobacteraceae bacterium]|nr:HupE/UreJ family protein [Steroidobacteraceae bacterium]
MPSRHKPRSTTCAVLLLAALTPASALAHSGHELGTTLMAGLLHPLTGLDHVLMIVAVSAWAALLAPRARVAVAYCLALFVGLGAIIPVAGGAGLEAAIAVTVVGAGVLLALGRRWPLWAMGTLAAVFALVHGFAHGAEGPARSGTYIAGLVVATAALALAVSVIAARLVARPLWLRATGALSAAAGATALFAQ